MIKYFLVFILSLQICLAEIDYVTIAWRPDACDERCNKLIAKTLEKIDEASRVDMNPSQGEAKLIWKTDKPFKYTTVNLPMKRVGVKLEEVFVHIRGNIHSSGKKYYLISVGDETKFELLSAPEPSTTEYVETKSIFNYALKNELKEAFDQAEAKKRLVTVEGPLFQPHRGSLKIVVNKASVK